MSRSDNNLLKIRRIAGGSIVEHAPLFSANGEILFTIWNNTVRLYSASTGEWLRDLEGVENEIISINLNVFNPKILIACSKTGEIFIWKWKSGVLLNSGQLAFPGGKFQNGSRQQSKGLEISQFIPIDIDGHSMSAVVCWKQSFNSEYAISFFDLETLNPSSHHRLRLTSAKCKIAVGYRFVAIVQETEIHAIFTDTNTYNCVSKSKSAFEHYTTVTCHPEEELILTGSNLGKIRAWRNIRGKGYPINTLYHWHTTDVNTLAFTKSGSHFFSGGKEAVLVKWMLDRTDFRDFKTRLQGDILHAVLSDDNQFIALSTDDNGIRIYNANKVQVVSIQHFTWMKNDKTERDQFPVRLILNPRTSNIVLNGVEGYLQFFSPQTRSLLYNIDITNENRLTEERVKILFNSRVVKAAFSMDWMVTAEVWDDRKLTPRTRLKFFKFDQENQNYALNTSMEMPHKNDITGLELSCVHSDPNILCASSGGDNIIKIWGLSSTGNIYRTDFAWYCQSRLTYKNLPIRTLAFSQDGSLISAGCGNVLCIWNAESSKLKCALSAPPALDGSLNCTTFRIAANIRPQNGEKWSVSKADKLKQSKILEKRQKIVEQIKLLLTSRDKSHVKKFIELPDNELKLKKVNIRTLNEKEKELLYNRIMQLNELNLHQKIELFAYLRIGCRTESETRTKLLEMLNRKRDSRSDLQNKVSGVINNLNERYKFIAKHKLNSYLIRRQKWVRARKVTPVTFNTILCEGNSKKSKISNGKSHNIEMEIEENETENDDDIPSEHDIPIKRLAHINHVVFGTGAHGHLVIACTENRLLIWNLLSLRLQTSVKLSVHQLAIDPYTNLIAAFTKFNELYVFQPNISMPLYHHKQMPNIFGAVWVPRRIPRQLSLNLDWQSTSQLFFLNQKQELLYLASDNDIDSIAPTVALSSDNPNPLPMTPFASILLRQPDSSINTLSQQNSFAAIGTTQTTVVKETITNSSHTMCPVMHLCQNFLKSLLVNDSSLVEKTKSNDKSNEKALMNGDENDNDDVEGDDDEDENDEKLLKRRQHLKLMNKLNGVNQSKSNNLEDELDKISKVKPSLTINI